MCTPTPACLLVVLVGFHTAAADGESHGSRPQRPLAVLQQATADHGDRARVHSAEAIARPGHDDEYQDVRSASGHAASRIDRRDFRGLGTLDWIVIGAYAALVVGLGWFYSRRQSSTEEYFLAGRRTNPLIAGISLFATLLSTISYLSAPGEVIRHGPLFYAGIIAMPVVYLIVGYLVIPALMRVRVTSAYELLESRVGLSVRLLGSGIFMTTRVVWMALLTYVSAKAFVTMLQWELAAVPYVIMVLGTIAVIYTALGGLRAVMVTDVLQFFVLVGGILLTIIFITMDLGGASAWLPTARAPHWDSQPLFSLSPTVRVTLLGSMISYTTFWVCASISDQVAIQRYLATRDARTARHALLTNLIADLVVSILLVLTGFALLGFFQHNPHLQPNGQDLLGDADFLFPHYIANFLPVGVAGLVVSAMLAAAMSSLDSGLNSITTVFSVDVLGRFGRSRHSDRKRLKIARKLTVGLGVAVVLLGCSMGMVPGNVLEVLFRTVGLFFAPLAGLFFTALFVRFATGIGTIAGAVCGFATAVLVAYWDVITGGPTLSFQWIIPTALVVQVAAGSLISAVSPKRLAG